MSDTSVRGISALTGTFLGLSVVIVGLRFCARARTKAPYLVDDWLMLTALASFIGTSVCIFLLVHIKAIGYSSFQFTTAEKIARYDESQKLQTALVATTVACLACTKASALFFYRRIFCAKGSTRRFFNGLLTTCIVVIACWFVTFFFMTIFQCKGRFHGLWDPKLYAKYCTVTWDFLYGFSVSDVLLDVMILGLPVPSILALRTTTSKKLSVLGVFMFACVALAASLTRLVIYVRVFVLGVDKFNNLDSEHILTQLIFYYILECGVSIVVLNLPSVWALFSGHGLEGIMKLARSVTSLSSRSSNRSMMKEKSIEGTTTRSRDASLYNKDKADNVFNTRDVPSFDASSLSTFGILREDSVHISTELRKPEEVHWAEEGRQSYIPTRGREF